MRLIEDRTKDDPQKMFKQAVDNVKPVVEVKSRRVGGATTRFRRSGGPTAGRRWRCAGSSATPGSDPRRPCRSGWRGVDRGCQHRGSSVKKREDTHKMAEANKAFAHYRW